MKTKRWLGNSNTILKDVISWLGLFWLFVEIASYSTDGQIDTITKSVPLFTATFLLITVFAFIKNKPKTTFSYRLRDRDNYVEIRVGDAFKNPGALVIPINDYFDVSLGGNVKKADSMQKRLIYNYYSDKEDHLQNDIEKLTKCDEKHTIGTVVEIEQSNKKFYLLANSHKKENNRVESTVEDFLVSLDFLWKYIALESGRDKIVTIPLISTQHGRITGLNRKKAIKEIIHSYVESSKKINICDKLIVSIYPSAVTEWEIDLDEIDDFLKLSCLHYRMITFNKKVEGKEIEPSEISNISN